MVLYMWIPVDTEAHSHQSKNVKHHFNRTSILSVDCDGPEHFIKVSYFRNRAYLGWRVLQLWRPPVLHSSFIRTVSSALSLVSVDV